MKKNKGIVTNPRTTKPQTPQTPAKQTTPPVKKETPEVITTQDVPTRTGMAPGRDYQTR